MKDKQKINKNSSLPAEKLIRSYELNDELKNRSFYDSYDYAFFWLGRDYEKQADALAVSQLLKYVRTSRKKLVDIGAGIGRMIPLYEKHWKTFILIDPSKKQLAIAQKNIVYQRKAKVILGISECLPIPDASCDTALCVRIFHYIADPERAIREMARVIQPGGNLILEIPNKIHFKEQLRAILTGRYNLLMTKDSTNHTKSSDTVFLRHHPKKIAHLLEKNGFVIVKKLSVSNFRSSLLKKIVPIKALIFFERLSQRFLARWWFGPSIYFLAQKQAKRK